MIFYTLNSYISEWEFVTFLNSYLKSIPSILCALENVSYFLIKYTTCNLFLNN